MFFCLGMDDGSFSIVDSSDGVVETFSKSDVEAYLSQGVVIYGVTLDSLSIGGLTSVYVNFPSKNKDKGRFFNGYFFEDYDASVFEDKSSTYLYSMINDLSCEDLLKVLKYIQETNKSIFSKIESKFPCLPEGYVVTDTFSDGNFNVQELNTSNEYGFSYSDVCFSILYDNLTIRGLTKITQDLVIINGVNYSIVDSIKNNLDVSIDNSLFYCDAVNCSSLSVDRISLSSASLDAFIQQYGDKTLSKSLFPMVSLFDYRVSDGLENCKASEFIMFFDLCKNKEYSGRNGKYFMFKDLVLPFDIAKIIYGIFKYSNPEFYKDVENYIAHEFAKEKLLKGVEPEPEKPRAYRLNNEYYTGKNKPFKNTLEYITTESKYDCHETDFGLIFTNTYIRDNEFLSNIGGFSIFKISRDKNFYYRIGRGGITIRLSTKYSRCDAKNISGSTFIHYLDQYRDTIGYLGNRPNIVPLFIHDVVEQDDGIEINIVVAVNSNKGKSFIPFNTRAKKVSREDKLKGWGTLFFVVPLLLTGTRHYFTGDYVIFDMLFQELVISKDVYNNLLADVDEFNDLICIDNCTEASSLKLCNCTIGETDSVSVNKIKGFIRDDMYEFNKMLENNSYFE